jgi:hypothetical protein
MTWQVCRTTIRSVDDYFSGLELAVEGASEFVNNQFGEHWIVRRSLPSLSRRSKKWVFLPWPKQPSTIRALLAYWSGLLSLTATGRIINFWRALEALTSRNDRSVMFKTLDSHRAYPVWSYIYYFGREGRTVNASAALRAAALKQRAELLRREGSSDAALDHLYFTRRGKAAHADRASAESAADLADQLRDSELIRHMARLSLDRALDSA